jgi:hypothetical protein
MKLMPVFVVGAMVAFASVAHADEWTHSQDFKYSQTASIRVVEPEGFKVVVNGKSDVVPAVFNLDNADAYMVVQLTAPDGKVWEKKIEVRANNQTVLRVKYTPAAAAAPAAGAKRSHIGSVKNTTHTCDREKRKAYKFDFRLDGKDVKSFELQSGKYTPNVELVDGNYEVRLWTMKSGQWVFQETSSFTVDKDGWVFFYGCSQ